MPMLRRLLRAGVTERGGTAAHNSYDVVTSPEKLVADAIDSYGQLDIVVNNAGVLGTKLFSETSSEDWHRLCDMHIRSAVGVSRSSCDGAHRNSAVTLT